MVFVSWRLKNSFRKTKNCFAASTRSIMVSCMTCSIRIAGRFYLRTSASNEFNWVFMVLGWFCEKIQRVWSMWLDCLRYKSGRYLNWEKYFGSFVFLINKFLDLRLVLRLSKTAKQIVTLGVPHSTRRRRDPTQYCRFVYSPRVVRRLRALSHVQVFPTERDHVVSKHCSSI